MTMQGGQEMIKSWITLNDLRFHAFHGVGEQERLCGNTFIVNLRFRLDISRAAQTDNVADTVSYAEVFEAVKDEMTIPSRLLEHAAVRIARRLLAAFPSIEAVQLKLEKLNPPMNADIHSAAVEIEISKDFHADDTSASK